eukprot:TRINITY_DN190_c0_g1_i1.p1 TRINITY_DN190_c0_g1~~TRINITY_DN190_c0_g1_i1.p1  ORF type:complete len:487 (+),score=140.36 TRINITY_DN190_c0_g1_i1:3-1463(+)
MTESLNGCGTTLTTDTTTTTTSTDNSKNDSSNSNNAEGVTTSSPAAAPSHPRPTASSPDRKRQRPSSTSPLSSSSSSTSSPPSESSTTTSSSSSPSTPSTDTSTSPSTGSDVEATMSTTAAARLPFEFFKEVLHSPKHFMAPMVHQSELAFRMLCRKYDTTVCYTPMFHSKNFALSAAYRAKEFSTVPEDRPLVVQFCANDPEYLLQAARFVEDQCDAIDINLGCPQGIAKRGNYGAFLMEKEKWELVRSLVETLHKNIKIPVWCKIRLLPSLDDTIAFAKMLEGAGCQLLAVHGRTKEQKGHQQGMADWDAIRIIKNTLSIPVISNGNITKLDDVNKCIADTGVDGVMSACGLLANPGLFAGEKPDGIRFAREYIETCRQYPVPLRYAHKHMFPLVKDKLIQHKDCMEMMHHIKGIDDLDKVLDALEEKERNPPPPPTPPETDTAATALTSPTDVAETAPNATAIPVVQPTVQAPTVRAPAEGGQ